MSFEDKIKAHPVHDSLKSLKNRVEKIVTDNESGQLDEFKRILAVLVYTESRLKNLDPLLTPISHFQTLNKHITGINNEINNFLNSKDINQLLAASNRADVLITQVEQLPKAREPGEESQNFVTNYGETFDRILDRLIKKRKDTTQEFENLKNKISQFENELTKHSNIIEKQKGRLDIAITEFQKQFSESEDRRRESFEKRIKDSNKELSANVEKNKTDFQNLLSEKKDEIDKTIEDIKHLAEINLDQAYRKAENLFESHGAQSQETLEYLKNAKREAGQLLNIISNIGVTGNYKEIANSERIMANWLRGFAIVFMIVGIGVIADFVIKLTKDDIDWRILLLRLGITLVIFIPAFYLTRESGLHRRNEIRNRKMELELASFNPYLELLPEKERVEVKVKMADKFFAQPEPIIDEKAYVKADNIFGLLEKVVLNLSKCFKS